MAQCAQCNAETELYIHGKVLCPTCRDGRDLSRQVSALRPAVRATLLKEVESAAETARRASRAFLKITGEKSSGLPDSDGSQRIQNAARVLSNARQRLAHADARLNDFLCRDIIPDDLK
jgi:hypothetical protein